MKRTLPRFLCACVLALVPAYAAGQTLDLSADGADLILRGSSAGAHAGIWLDQGAISSDGRNDLVIGAPGDASSPGHVYVVFGGPVREGTYTLDTSNVIISGDAAGDGFGTSTAVGNILTTEGSSIKAIAVGAPGAFGGKGAVYVFRGNLAEGTTLSTADAAVTIVGKPGDALGTALGTGDLNNDGYREIIMGAPGNKRVYTLNGGASLSGTIDLSTTAPSSTISGAPIGSVITAGDVNNDGVYDILLGAPDENAGAGTVYLINGRTSGGFPSSITLAAGASAYFMGRDPSDLAGTSIRLADVDADGYKDIVIGAPGGDGEAGDRPESGETYVLWGSAAGFSPMSLGSAPVIFYGAHTSDRLGVFITSGDVNRDIPDDLVMRSGGGPNSSGLVDLYYGRARSSFGVTRATGQRVVDFADAGNVDRIILGDSGDGPLISAQVFEVTGEGAKDIILTAPYAATASGQLSGNVYFTISPKLAVSSRNLTIDGGTSANTTLDVIDASLLSVPWTAEGNASWLTVAPASGSSVKNSPVQVTITAAGGALSPGAHTAKISVSSTSRDLDMTLPVNVTFNIVSGASVSPSTGSPMQAGTAVTFTAMANGGGLPLEYKFWRQKDGGAWTVVQNYSASNTYTWTPSLADTGRYLVQVWVRRQGATVDYSTWSNTNYFDVTKPSPKLLSLSANVASPVAPGTPITWAATASGGIAPLEYKCWLQNPNGSWTVVRDWTTSNTCSWTAASSPQGSYNFQLWVRNSGGSDMDDWRGMTFTVSSTTPVIRSFTASPANQVSVGQPVTWTASAAGGTAGPLQYRFWRYSYATSSWTLVRDWGTANTYTWTPAKSDAGRYAFQVWVRSAGSSASYEAFAASDAYSVVYTPVTLTSFTANRPSPVTHGTSVTWTAQASGGAGQLEYRFWRYKNGAGWTIVQDYSAANTFSWTPGAADTGSYTIQVWVRSVGSTDWEAYGSLDLIVQ